MKYKFANVTTERATIGDLREQIQIETVDQVPTNDLSGDSTDQITVLATVWAAVIVKKRGLERMLTINTDKEEIATHEFYCRFWDEAFLEARYISWRGDRYRIIRPTDLKGKVGLNFQIKFECVLKGDTTKLANTWG